MKHKNKLVFFLSLTVLLSGSCRKYLDVQPVDKFLSEQVFSSSSSMEKALNGIYINLAKPALYGENLSSTTLDVMAQYYDMAYSGNGFSQMAGYNYAATPVQTSFNGTWSGAYTAILNLNQFIAGVSASGNILSSDERAMMLGESFGLRALVLFDLLRLFGPIYILDSAKAAIPYPVSATTNISPYLSANTAIDSIVHDLQKASVLLANDPVTQNGVQPIDNSGSTASNFFRSRNKRMNYYAVQGLMARVLLYRGDKQGALQRALDLISKASVWFPWSPSDASQPNLGSPDRIFSSEVIFGLENTGMTATHLAYFAATNSLNGKLLAPLPDILSGVYENYLNDYRFRSCWAVDRTTNQSIKTFIKYAPPNNLSAAAKPSFYNLQPLLRISEMYYIAAECTDDQGQAVSYLNKVRFNRGLPDLTGNIDLSDEIKKEYQKEFWGEGQLFFYYKRLNFPSLISGSDESEIPMDGVNYAPPLPLSETQYR